MISVLLCSDYKAMPQLDRYEDDGLDERNYDDMSYAQRMMAERAMRIRDRLPYFHCQFYLSFFLSFFLSFLFIVQGNGGKTQGDGNVIREKGKRPGRL